MKPSILVRLHINKWSNKKEDDSASQEIRTQYNNGTAAVVKRLFGRGSPYDKLVSHQQWTRQTFNNLTVPWDDRSWRCVAADQYKVLMPKMREAFSEHETLKQKLEQEYPDMVREDQIRQGKLHNFEDYPSTQELLDHFKMEIFFAPVPREGDFRVDFDQDTLEELTQSFVRDRDEKLTLALQDTYEKVKKVMAHLKEKMETYGPGKRLYDSTLTNVVELADTLPGLNIMGDPKLDDLAKEIKLAFANQDVETLKENQTSREWVAKEANRFLEFLK